MRWASPGLGWNRWVLPVRVLGKCGGYDSDIADGMVWAAGLAVAGVPGNPFPARVINLSLGGGDTCPQNYPGRDQSPARARCAGGGVRRQQRQHRPVPANCVGVAGVGAIRHAGTKVGFSNLGPGVALSAPGGNA